MPHSSVADVYPDQPDAYEWIVGEPAFDPARHLQLEAPDRLWTLEEFGYDEAFVASQASPIAMFSPSRMLSDEGVAALHETISLLKPLVRQAPDSHRISGYLRGTVFLSKFIRDLCRCDEITEFMSGLFGTALAPHTMVYQQGHMNFAPDDISKPVDHWHHDFVGFDYVLMAHDPATVEGGEFKVFMGTREEGNAILERGEELPVERVIAPQFPGAGYTCFMQGNAVFHCAAPLKKPADRVSLVNAYVSLDIDKPDPTRTFFVEASGRYAWLKDEVEPHHSWAEYARHTAWLGREKLTHLLDDLPLDAGREQSLAALRQAASDLERAIKTIDAGPLPYEEMEALRRRQDDDLLKD